MTDLAGSLRNLYEIPVDSINIAPYGYTNQNYLVQSGRKKYVVRVSPSYKIMHLPFESYVLNNLDEKNLGFAIPRKVMTVDERDFTNIDTDGAITVFEFISGDSAFKLGVHPFYVVGFSQDFGSKVGRLHSALSQMPFYTPAPTHTDLIKSYLDRFELYKFRALQSKHMTVWQTLLLRNMTVIMEELFRYTKQRNLSHKEIVHTDLRLDNVLIENNRISGIVDFDDVLMGDQAYDLSKILVEIYSNRREVARNVEDLFDIKRFGEFIKQYLETRKMKGSEVIPRIIDLLPLPALHVLSIVGRDPDFDENERVKNIEWYTNFIRLLNNEENVKWVRSAIKRNSDLNGRISTTT